MCIHFCAFTLSIVFFYLFILTFTHKHNLKPMALSTIGSRYIELQCNSTHQLYFPVLVIYLLTMTSLDRVKYLDWHEQLAAPSICMFKAGGRYSFVICTKHIFKCELITCKERYENCLDIFALVSRVSILNTYRHVPLHHSPSIS